jgi:hypothetical protein
MRVLLAVLTSLFLGTAWAQMEPGEWQFTSTATSAMFPQPQTTTITHCVRPEDVGDPQRWMSKPPSSDCTSTPGERTASTYSWEFSCPRSNLRGKGTVRYGQGTLESDLQMTGDVSGQKFDISTKTSGKRLGPCKA